MTEQIIGYYVQARSIDGTVFYNHGSWMEGTCEDAQIMTKVECEGVVENRKRKNREVDPDAIIGQFQILAVYSR